MSLATVSELRSDVLQAGDKEEKQDLLDLLKNWDKKADRSERASAEGVLYLVNDTEITSIPGTFALTANLLEMLQANLADGETIVSVSQHDQYSKRQGNVPLEHLLAHGLWLISADRVLKVRCLHQVSYLPREDWSGRPYKQVLVPTYRPHSTEMEFPFIERAEIENILRP